MSDTQADPIDISQFKNGDDVHFDYNGNANDHVINPSSDVHKKKKKKKNKNKHKSPTDVEATINDPDVDYPTSRVIKQAPNGDVIIESLDEPTESASKAMEASIWDNATIEEQENLKSFWESLDESQKLELVRIDKKSIMDIFKNEARAANTQGSHQNSNNITGHHVNQGNYIGNGPTPNTNASNGQVNGSNGMCTCSYCGRKNTFIEDELENIYDNHFDDIIDFIHEVRDINDLNALPGLLFGGFHMLEEEHRLQKRQQKYKYRQENNNTVNNDGNNHNLNHHHNNSHSHSHSHNHFHSCDDGDYDDPSEHDEQHEHEHSHTHDHEHYHDDNHNDSHSHFQYDKIDEVEEKNEIQEEAILRKSLEAEVTEEDENESVNTLKTSQANEQQVFHKLLDPKLFEALENLDFDKMKDISANNNSTNILEKAGSLREIIRDLHKADKVELEKGVAFLQNMGSIFSGDMKNNMNHDKLDGQLSQGLSSFAEDLLKNDGNSFIDMMESLSESRTAREDLLKENFENDLPAAWIDEDDNNKAINSNINNSEQDSHKVQELEEETNDVYDIENEDAEEDEEDEYEEDEEGNASDTESEISEEEKMQEIRRLFLIQVIKLFQERLKNAYKERLSQDRTKMLIEELEAEESAKRERELKKLKQKEKAKEKKRLLQLAKDEEKRRKEEEQKAKEEELKQKQEYLRTEQKRRKEEAKQKRDEEKKKRIEELKRKELEQQKKLEVQRKKEDEAKKLKEERKKKLEEERKQKEEEKKQKELEKKQAEEERLKSLNLQHGHDDILENTYQIGKSLDNIKLSSNTNTVSPILPETILSQLEQNQRTQSPTKNHILDQLYQAKPRSYSSSVNTTPTVGQSATGYNLAEHAQNNVIPSVLSPTPHHLLPNNTANLSSQQSSSTASPWSSQTFNAKSQPQPALQSHFAPNSFSPFTSSLGSNPLSTHANENINTNPLGTTGFNDSFAPNNHQTSVWNPGSTSRNNSIWRNAPSVPSNSTLWNNSVPVPPSVGSVGNAPVNPPNNLDSDLIQTAAYQAFQHLQATNQLEFGVAPSMKLFHTTKTILSNQLLTLNQFLTLCRNSGTLSGYIFDFIYDDFGTVTHIKVSPANLPHPHSHGLGTPPPALNNIASGNPPTTNILGNGAIINNESSLLNSFSDINSNSGTFPSGTRGLWR